MNQQKIKQNTVYMIFGLCLLFCETIWFGTSVFINLQEPTIRVKASVALARYISQPEDNQNAIIGRLQLESIYIWPMAGVSVGSSEKNNLTALTLAIENSYKDDYLRLEYKEKQMLTKQTIPSIEIDIRNRIRNSLMVNLEEAAELERKLEMIDRYVGATRYQWDNYDKSLYYILVHDKNIGKTRIYFASVSDIAEKLSLIKAVWIPFALLFLTSLIVILTSIIYQRRQSKNYTTMLEQQVADRTILLEKEIEIDKISAERLKTSQSQLVQSAKLASLGEMATVVAHELTQPIHVISSKAQLTQKYVNKNRLEKVLKSSNDILQQVERASIIIKHMRTFGRDTSKSAHKKEDINQIIEDAFILVGRDLYNKNVTVTKKLHNQPLLKTCNKLQIEQVLINLINNAKDAMDQVDIKNLSVHSFLEDGVIAIEVEDTGEGISESNAKQIFDPFFTTKSEGKGTGLGLSISHGIITDHKGKLIVSSEKGKGTKFTIELPLDE